MDNDNSRISIPRVLTNRKILMIKYSHPTKSFVSAYKNSSLGSILSESEYFNSYSEELLQLLEKFVVLDIMIYPVFKYCLAKLQLKFVYYPNNTNSCYA